MNVEHLAILGKKVKDKVTGFTGVATSVSFDLYGCVQVTVDGGFDKRGDRQAHWFDYHRLGVVNNKPVMEPPSSWTTGEQRKRREPHGPAEKGIGR